MPGLVVVNGAQLQCDKCPGASANLAVSSGGFSVAGQAVATLNDHISGTNIPVFSGVCQTTHQPCKPATSAPWNPGEVVLTAHNCLMTISKSAILKCSTGSGTITISDPGQSKLRVEKPTCKTAEEPGGIEGFLLGLIDDVTMADVANAPGPNECILHDPSQSGQMARFAASFVPAGKLGKLAKDGSKFMWKTRVGKAVAKKAIERPRPKKTQH